MVKIVQDFIPKGRNNRPGYAMNPSYITVHNTANTSKGANAALHARYVKNPETGTSWHFTVDEKEIYQHLPLNENGWHAGDGNGNGNRKSIGIEICENSDGHFEKAVSNAQWLVKKLMKEQGISLANVVPHQHWSGKYCPRKLLDRWDSFKSGISGAPSNTVSSPVVKTKESYIKNTVISDSLNVRTQRNANSSIVLALPRGSTVQYKKGSTQNGWGYIKYTNSKGATYSGYVNVSYIKSNAELGKTSSKSAPAESSNKTSGGIKSVGEIKIVGVKNAAIIMDKPDRKNAKNVDTIGLGKTINISGSVKGTNNSKGYWEVIHDGKRRYVSGQYGKLV
ncbi:N-acetylmuramoyl-L-alanine amidase [Bacillus atrophaeus]|uniref:N-acetylmuramoyl-L-alanine amidase n=1 Tax=Bacillus atrophaeus TaxID=1452 RepID=UPI00227DFC30|nr:N-acetylmuramoyl-L-alanine amidase [Bacillus atrophaeus]MCY7947303.1 N-acetylmuramoyl-L-alanine amidase [Bacillus atrophaeus]MCY8094559.1 N-acetylmuramoyl-L-alanine amidase [Bacillus atrophaeus]MCY9168067.1 N-acetylmuramoyl-L-alanine amidase [Bacillus atrophaeus]MEC0742007.1 N-acetylmuramoyl-L-alanine amidase [Bacillus atrophaeus]MEC0744679.1 N-acetylmuramoyl-L-alanine amidase [Bacillus atrophaeus]